MRGLFFVMRPESETAIDPSQEEAVAGSYDSGTALPWTKLVIQGFAIGEGDSSGVGVDFICIDNRVRDVGPVVIGSPSGLGLEIQTSVSEVEIVIAEDSFSGRFSLFGRVALGKSDKKPFARHSAIGNLDEASFFRLQKGLR